MSHAAHEARRPKLPRIYYVDNLPIAELVIWPAQWSTFIYVQKGLPPGRAVAALRRATRSVNWLPNSHRHSAMVLVFFSTCVHWPLTLLAKMSITAKVFACLAALGLMSAGVAASVPRQQSPAFPIAAPGRFPPEFAGDHDWHTQKASQPAPVGAAFGEWGSTAPSSHSPLVVHPAVPDVMPAPTVAPVLPVASPIMPRHHSFPTPTPTVTGTEAVTPSATPTPTPTPTASPASQWWWGLLPKPSGRHAL